MTRCARTKPLNFDRPLGHSATRLVLSLIECYPAFVDNLDVTPRPAKAECGTKARLMGELLHTTTNYGSCLENLYAKMATLAKAEYDRMLRECDDLREVSEHARHDLHRHIVEHGC